MDQYFEIIVFLITFIIFVFTAIRKQKKKPDASGKVSKPSAVEDALASLFGIPLEEVGVEKVPEFKEIEPIEEDELEQRFKARKVAPVVEPSREGIDAIPDEEEASVNQEEAYSPLSDFDARQAIIYSEIMNRKY